MENLTKAQLKEFLEDVFNFVGENYKDFEESMMAKGFSQLEVDKKMKSVEKWLEAL